MQKYIFCSMVLLENGPKNSLSCVSDENNVLSLSLVSFPFKFFS